MENKNNDLPAAEQQAEILSQLIDMMIGTKNADK
jgi:hypothetical protein